MSDAAAQIRLKMISYRAWHRGFREADFILGGFADQHLAGFNAEQLIEFEALLEQPDQLLYSWIVGQEPPPEEVLGDVFSMLQHYRVAKGGNTPSA
jgi:antitoxin CptB